MRGLTRVICEYIKLKTGQTKTRKEIHWIKGLRQRHGARSKSIARHVGMGLMSKVQSH